MKNGKQYKIWRKIKGISRQDWMLEEMELKVLRLTQVSGSSNRGRWCIKIRGLDFPDGAVVKSPPASAGDTGLTPGPGRSHVLQNN